MIVDETLSPREVALIAAMSAHPSATQEELAKELRITSRYVRKLLARERVRKALDASARAGLVSASTALGRGAQRAAEALVAMATGASRSTTPRVAACKAVLEGAARLVDAVDVDSRLKKLEAVGSRLPGGYQ